MARPSPALGLDLDPAFFRVLLRLRLRIPVASSDGYCPLCDGIADRFGDHARACPCGGDRTKRHNRLRTVLAAKATAAGLSPEVEKMGLLPERPEELGASEAGPPFPSEDLQMCTYPTGGPMDLPPWTLQPPVVCGAQCWPPLLATGLRQLQTTRSEKRSTTILPSCVLDKAYSSSRWWLKPAAAGGARPPLPPSDNWALCTLLDLGCLRVMGPNNFSKLCLLPCNVRTRGPSSDGSLSPLTVCHPWPSLDLFDFDIWFLITPQSPESHRDQ